MERVFLLQRCWLRRAAGASDHLFFELKVESDGGVARLLLGDAFDLLHLHLAPVGDVGFAGQARSVR